MGQKIRKGMIDGVDGLWSSLGEPLRTWHRGRARVLRLSLKSSCISVQVSTLADSQQQVRCRRR